ncbi:MAG: AAA family ATPase [Ignavibacteriae bacterium]|nr:AAA family ATPase [Ignavibacteriota bacterium]
MTGGKPDNFLIAVTGKGGVGKTTLAALVIHCLIRGNRRPVLAVDADPNMCLNLALGVDVGKTVGGVREEAREAAGKGLATGVAKQQLLEMKIAESLVEGDDFDLIAMGRPEGPGCYCYSNNVLKSVLGQIAAQYPYVVLDNEAGLENLSRRLVQRVDLLMIVADPSQQGLETIRRIHALAVEMEIRFEKLVVVINRVRRDIRAEQLATIRSATHADDVVILPDDDEIAEFSEKGTSLLLLSEGNTVVQRLDALLATYCHTPLHGQGS